MNVAHVMVNVKLGMIIVQDKRNSDCKQQQNSNLIHDNADGSKLRLKCNKCNTYGKIFECFIPIND